MSLTERGLSTLGALIWLSSGGCLLIPVRTTSDGTVTTPIRTDESGTTETEVRVESVTVAERTGADSRLAFSFDVPEGASALQITAVATEAYISVDALSDPFGDTVVEWTDWGGAYSLTGALFPHRLTMAMDWPIRREDGPLVAGRWTLGLASTDQDSFYVPDVDVELTTTVKFDPDFSRGRAAARVVYARGVDDELEVVEAVEAAVARWAEIWAERGVELSVRYGSSNLDAGLGFVDVADPRVVELAEALEPGEIQVVVGESFADPVLDGLAAATPGSVVATSDAFVAVSWLAHAGTNGRLSEEEALLMGETMAHEAGHYFGLFHPVEATYDAWDALSDTTECGNPGPCENQLGDNVMFPYPLCDGGACSPQGELTVEQGTVVQQYVGVR